MRIRIAVACLLLATSVPAIADISIGLGLPSVRIGINLPMYPDLELVPGYPVYYAPGQGSNLFFYDGLYWVYSNDQWYSSDWYNGPWDSVGPEDVPLFILRVPVQYYRQPPQFFFGWSSAASPRWGEHWGRDWEHRRSGWDQWDHRSMPRAAPAPSYQRNFSGNRYPSPDQQHRVRSENYGYTPQDAAARRQFEQPARPAQPQQGAGRDGGDRRDAAADRAGNARQGAPADRASSESRDQSRPSPASQSKPPADHAKARPAQSAPAAVERRGTQPDPSSQRRQTSPTQREAPQEQQKAPQRDPPQARPQQSHESGAADGQRHERKREADQPREH